MSVRNIAVTAAFAMALGMTAWAQTPAQNDPSQGTNPSTQSSPSQGGDMANQDRPKGERKLKGCIESEAGKFMLREKNGKDVQLSGSQDFASHVGHTVAVHGTYTGSESASGVASGAPSDQFTVTKIDMVSDTCKEKAGKTKENESGKPSPYHQ